MKLMDVTVHGFGRLYRRTFSFQDGIHVIYGPNEAGKSTLHTFIGCMLFGLERGRGRAARGDLYSRCIPWENDASYGGTLTFESNDMPCRLERNFRSDNRSCIFTAPGQNPVSCPDNSLPVSYYEGLTESLYYNTISVRQLKSAADISLAEELGRHLADTHQTGTDSIDYAASVSWLKAEAKRLEALLDPTLEARILHKKQESALLKRELAQTSFVNEKISLENQMEACIVQLTCEEEADNFPDESMSSPSFAHRRFLSALAALLFLILSVFLWKNIGPLPAFAAAAAALISAGLILRSPRSRMSDDAEQLPSDQGSSGKGPSPLNDSESEYREVSADGKRLRTRIQSLQKRYQEVCRQEWEYDRLLEQSRKLQEELETLNEQARTEEGIRLEIQAVSLALTTLQRLAGQMKDTIGPHLNDSMSRILSGLTDGRYSRVYVDSRLNVSVSIGSRTVSLDFLSRGTIEQIHLAMRLAVIDLLFPQGGMPLLLDDCFLAYDDGRLSQTLLWLAENYSGQIFIFTCQKREAALLRQEQIPFTFISL